MSTAVYTVKGMTCSGCMNKVTTAVTGVAGITDVDVDIATGEVTVTSDAPIDERQVTTAIAGAGYEVVSRG
ncbi:heavy-metal-associated domain-containing protein [Amycolatopsis rhizosphaerae]|uniref:Heavy-metal-associated domain-containing protein n=1 Tax=Amycolatopsis rhizosphaerae TaxID=2053003 RepID=A0A558DNP0_9PSEU|nr:heavy metal-associated domain-containing protein [Amycolatopsis rhizosphaerae]TVT62632.1 heavy-metal-associated domain-containing protein [Amycolatopsis rhizosphaerae]